MNLNRTMRMYGIICTSVVVSLRFVTLIIDGLKKLYVQKLKPLEVNYRVNDFVSPLLSNSGFDAKPMVMLLGQYSTGKTTFIKHLLRTSYPGAQVGHEPTMDIFVAVMVCYYLFFTFEQ
ncbi:EPS15 homology domain 1 [Perilla frutescens var. frutescens]|nr:EPS15 homology domain 1 [Perilla frutescens var. frutescens]